MKSKKPTKEKSAEKSITQPHRPSFALVSQILVAFSLELDNEFERQMTESGYAASGLSWSIWTNVMKFVGEGIRVEELSAQTPLKDTHHILGCLERWRVIVLEPAANDDRPVQKTLHRQTSRELRPGWGSGRGIRKEWFIRPTTKGQTAIQLWPGVFESMEKRWRARFGETAIEDLRAKLATIVKEANPPPATSGGEEEDERFPASATREAENVSTLTLLSWVLLAYAMEFRADSSLSLGLCANVIRVLSEKPIPSTEVVRLTGASPETCAIGWRLKHFVREERDPNARRGTTVRLNPRGLETQARYRKSVEKIEANWQEQFGDTTRSLRATLEGFFEAQDGAQPKLVQGLLPPEGVARSGFTKPSLGRLTVSATSKRRSREMTDQTNQYIKNPAQALPWFPLWDMNRGFGV
jgi:hypothetical protein